MNTNTMLKSKWYLVEVFTAKKAFRITVRKPLDTKVEALAFENSRYKGASIKNEPSDAVKAFLSTPPSQPSVKPFDYTKQSERYEKRGRVRAEKALAEQMAEYREV